MSVGEVQSLHIHKLRDVKVAYEIGSRDMNDSAWMHTKCGWEVHAFEPNPDQAKHCRLTASLSEDLHLHEFAVLDYNGETEFNRMRGHMDQIGSSSCLKVNDRFDQWEYVNPKNWKEPIEVPCRRIDSLIDEGVIPPAQFAQIDVQGVEAKVIKSFGKYLDDLICMLVEVSVLPQYQGSDLEFDVDEYLIGERNFVMVARREPSDGCWFHDVLYCHPDWVDKVRKIGWDGGRVERFV